ncbi:MAG: HEAT repeat domain-containing protein, partial [Candidatus Hydrothermarchaeota archaeon]
MLSFRWKAPLLLAFILLLSGCITPSPAGIGDLLKSLASDKDFTFGYKAYYPLSASPAMSQLIALGPSALPELQAELAGSQDPQYRKALLFTIAHMDDPRAEEELVKALGDKDLKGLSAFLLGNYLYRPSAGDYNKPESFVRDRSLAVKALFPFLRDTSAYPITAGRFEARPPVGDLALGAFIRIGGPGNFGIDVNKYRWIGWEIPEYTDSERKELLRAAEAFFERTGGEAPPTDGGRGGEIPPGNRNETNITVANGTFTFVKEINNTHNASLEVDVNFTAVSTLACTKVLYIQIVRITNSTGGYEYPGGRMARRATGDGWSMDRIDDRTSPYYGTDDAGGEMGHTQRGRPGGRPAGMQDRPRGLGGDTYEFETCAFCVEGADAGKCYGCITWGFRINPDGKVVRLRVWRTNKPSDYFRRAGVGWIGQA